MPPPIVCKRKSRMNRSTEALVAFYQRWFDKHNGAAPVDDHGHHPRLINFDLASQAVRRVVAGNHKALRIQDFWLGFPASIYTSLTFNVGTQQPLHWDVPLFWTTPANHCFGVWTALEDADLGTVPHFSNKLWDDYQTGVNAEGRAAGLEERVVHMKMGNTLIWHALAPHGGTPIAESARTRFSIVFHTVPQGLAVYRGDVFYNPDHPRSRKVGSDWLHGCEQGRMYPMLGDPPFLKLLTVPSQTCRRAPPQRVRRSSSGRWGRTPT